MGEDGDTESREMDSEGWLTAVGQQSMECKALCDSDHHSHFRDRMQMHYSAEEIGAFEWGGNLETECGKGY